MASDRLLTVTELTGGYGGKPVLQGVDLSVGEGEIVAVIGRNGVGKTTLMKTLMGLLSPMAGHIHFAGEDITRLTADKRARLGIGYIPQGREVFTRLTVAENLLVGETAGAERSPADYERIYDFFPILAERSKQAAGTLSGGQQQQLAIGRAMIGEPRLMLLDEPSEGIQPSIVQEIARNVKRLNAETKVAVLLVEQNLDLIVSMAERGFVIDKGRIVATLDAEDVRSRDVVRRHLEL